MIICASIVVKHHCSLLSWPILYNSPLFSVKCFVLLTNHCFYCTKLCSIPPWMWMALRFGFVVFELLNCLHHRLLKALFFFLVTNIICFSWLSILEHLFFGYFNSCGNINIHHIHIYNECLCLSNKLNLCYCHRFSHETFSAF